MDEPPRTSSLKAPNLELIGHKVNSEIGFSFYRTLSTPFDSLLMASIWLPLVWTQIYFYGMCMENVRITHFYKDIRMQF